MNEIDQINQNSEGKGSLEIFRNWRGAIDKNAPIFIIIIPSRNEELK
jgi:hypothetical protein